MTRTSIGLLIFFICHQLCAQEFLQSVKGNVTDQTTGLPVSGANVRIEGDHLFAGTTDEKGNYGIEVLVGRYKLTVTHTGYDRFTEELVVISARKSIINIQLRPVINQLAEVEVTAPSMALELPSQRTLSIEKTLRIPANFFDPVRVATAYPGVVAANDQANAIIVRGNSPNGLQWRLNGLNIVNPNHLANAGTFSDRPMANGGGVNILSAQMLGATDFYTGAFPLSYGNALSGIIDMRLRAGNQDEMEYTGQASLIGLDIAAEGPVGKSQNTSFVSNYRYSTVGLLSQLGVDFGGEKINFQDIAFNLTRKGIKDAEFSVFGFGGLSSNKFQALPMDEIEQDKDAYDINYESLSYAVGAKYERPVTAGKFFAAVGVSSSDHDRLAELVRDFQPAEDLMIYDENDIRQTIVSSQLRLNSVLSPRFSSEVGATADYITYDYFSVIQDKCLGCPVNDPYTLDEKIEGVLFQPFASWEFTISSRIVASTGLRYVYYGLNDSQSMEPRIQIDFLMSPNVKFNAAYTKTSQIQPVQVYIADGNSDLGLTKAHHADVSALWQLENGISVNANLFYQYLYDIPVADNTAWSVFNLMESFSLLDLVQEGEAKNYGIDITAEKQFYGGHYFVIGGSYYRSQYLAGDNVWRESRFNGNFTSNLTYGKEWTNVPKRRVLSLNTRMLYLGGMRYFDPEGSSLVDIENEIASGYPHQLTNYFRVDLRLSIRKNKPNYTRTLALDIQNLANVQNEAGPYFDFFQDRVVMRRQLGIIPVLVYRIDF